jgi:hypothetical protein
MENENTQSVDEVDVEGGWLLTHWTKTWDTRTPISSLQQKREDAAARLKSAQDELDALDTTLATPEVQTALQVAEKPDTVPSDSSPAPEPSVTVEQAPVEEATSTPAIQ